MKTTGIRNYKVLNGFNYIDNNSTLDTYPGEIILQQTMQRYPLEPCLEPQIFEIEMPKIRL